MRTWLVLLGLIGLSIIVAGCTVPIPNCDANAPVHFQVRPTSSDDVEEISQAFRSHGWTNITVTFEGPGAFGSYLVAADCPKARTA